ncbi:MAG: LamG domain-containing protein [Anaerolineae bacterium]|nr:LamG domain-containing protein [Anaerolineae bacterium]
MTTLIDGLVAHWSLEEDGASGRVDSHRTNDLTAYNTPAAVTGVIGNACQFVRASSQCLYIATNSDLTTGDIDFTFSCWVKLTSKPARMTIAAKDVAGFREWCLMWNTTDRFDFGIITNADAAVAVLSDALGAPALDTWYHIVVWHDAAGNEIGIRVNDMYENTMATGSTVPGGTSATFVIGAREYVGAEDYLDGAVDAPSFWKRLLTSGEKTALYQVGLEGISYPWRIDIRDGLVGAWLFDREDGRDGVSGNDLTAWNAPGFETQPNFRGNALVCDAAKAMYHASNDILKVGDEPFTFSCWVKLTSKPAYYQGIVSKHLTASGTDDYLLYYDNSADRFVWDPGSRYAAVANALGSPALDTWYHICAWHDPYIGEAGILIDNTYLDVDSSGTSPIATSDEFDIGTMDGRNSTTVGLRGSIDEVYFWKRLLTTDEKSRISQTVERPGLFPFGAVNNRTRRGIARGVGRGT